MEVKFNTPDSTRVFISVRESFLYKPECIIRTVYKNKNGKYVLIGRQKVYLSEMRIRESDGCYLFGEYAK